jgi:hypothetical protein
MITSNWIFVNYKKILKNRKRIGAAKKNNISTSHGNHLIFPTVIPEGLSGCNTRVSSGLFGAAVISLKTWV